MTLRTLAAVLKKDARSLPLLVLLTTLLFAGDIVVTRFELLPVWSEFRHPVLLLMLVVMLLSLFQLDSPVSMVDDWLCRPVPRAELLSAKLLLLFAATFLSRAVATLACELVLGASLTEAALDAVTIQTPLYLALLPLLLFIALVTRTLVQGLGVLIAILLCVFVIPTPVVRGPGPLQPAIGEALVYVGMEWLAFLPALLLSAILTALGCWLVFWRRRIKAARLLLGAMVVSGVILVLLPMWLLPWRSVSVMQSAIAAPESPPETQAIYLRNSRDCFTAARLGELASDPAFTAARGGLRTWDDEALRGLGPESIAFLTAIEARRLPPDWRVKLNYVQAEYWSKNDTMPLFSLRPAAYDTDRQGPGRLAHAWLLPDAAVKRLTAEEDVRFTLRYFLTLLEPRPFRLPTDGEHHAVPGLGHCRAQVTENGARIDVDCFSAGRLPAQVSAELNEIPATRVYSAVDFSPSWTQWVQGRHVRLSLDSPRLAAHDTITVTAWRAAAYFDRTLKLPGLLGGDAQSCPLPGALAASGNAQGARWSDTAPHQASSLRVDDGVTLEVLDFGGTGSPLLLLPGLGATAHSFDELAPRLAQRHRVFAMTRRGTGYSSRPEHGFDTPRLAQDVLAVMDALRMDQVVLVGHSIAGDELTWLGGHHPARFRGLVYLDAAYDRSGEPAQHSRLRKLTAALPPEPPIPAQAFLNYEAASRFIAARGHLRPPQGELMAFLQADKAFVAGTPNMDVRAQQAIAASLAPPDYAAVSIPALAIFAINDPAPPLPPWYDPADPSLRDGLGEIARIVADAQRREIERFRQGMKQGQVLEMADTPHNLFYARLPEVAAAIESFVSQLPER